MEAVSPVLSQLQQALPSRDTPLAENPKSSHVSKVARVSPSKSAAGHPTENEQAKRPEMVRRPRLLAAAILFFALWLVLLVLLAVNTG